MPPPSFIEVPQDEDPATVAPEEDLAREDLNLAAVGVDPAQEGRPTLQRRVRFKRPVEEEDKPKPKYSSLFEKLARLAEEEEEEKPVEDDTQAPKVLQAKRLSRTGATPEGNPLAFRPRSDQPAETEPARNFADLALLLVIFCVLLLGLVAYLLSRPSSRDGTASSLQPRGQLAQEKSIPAPALVTDRALTMANDALAAVQRGEVEKAAGLYQQARDEKLFLPGLDYQSALLALAGRKYDLAFSLVNRCLAANESVPECLYLRANTLALEGDYALPVQCFSDAARLTPFSPRYYFFWAECLRRQGNPEAAVSQFKQALLRRPSLAETDLIKFRMNLARIEMGTDKALEEELASQLSAPTPSTDTLLLGAANELTRGNYAAAASHLRRAAQNMPRPALELRLRDYFFRPHLPRPEVTAVLSALKPSGQPAPVSAEQQAAPVDLATRSLAEGDPSAWP